MNRRSFIEKTGMYLSTGTCLTAAAVNCNAESQKRRGAHPNVILIMTDQQRFDSLGCNGNPDALTP
ncbi:hypothetical protein BVY01_01310, partial [bacterium I07]